MKWLALALTLTAAGYTPAFAAKSSDEGRWLLTGTRVYVGPDVAPLDNAWVLVEGSKIKAVGDASAAKPANVQTNAACSGGVVTAGFQNSHVHFMDPAYADASKRPSAELERPLSQMLTGFGYTTVVDTGSDITVTAALRKRIGSGDTKGPAILTAGIPIYPKDGLPFYLRDLPPEVLQMLVQPAMPDEAVAHVRANFKRGADAIKLFVATPQGGGVIKRMSAEVARAAAAEAHKQGRLVMAHPTDPQGAADAVAAGVDILVHTTIDGTDSVWSDQLIRDMVAGTVSVIPTLKLWRYELNKSKLAVDIREKMVGDAEKQLKRFSDAGGQVLFGTDVGYMTEFDPTDEYLLMARAGLTPMQILASLTTNPATRWSEANQRGRVKTGLDADLVVLDGDPATNVKHFSAVKCTIRRGREIFVRGTT
jgi:imidazolonepropionase-like amidohydrolase